MLTEFLPFFCLKKQILCQGLFIPLLRLAITPLTSIILLFHSLWATQSSVWSALSSDKVELPHF